MRNLEDVYPLSPLQEGMLFHSLYAPDSGVYVEQLSCALDGPLDQAAFARAWERVVERHAVLRTAFVWKSQKRLSGWYTAWLYPAPCRARQPASTFPTLSLIPCEHARRTSNVWETG